MLHYECEPQYYRNPLSRRRYDTIYFLNFSNLLLLCSPSPSIRCMPFRSASLPLASLFRHLVRAMTTTATPTGAKKIVTHNGTFHCDEALACYMLQTHVSEFQSCSICRTRDASIIAGADVAAVVDVGGVYDHTARRYDHHQRGFSETFSDTHPTKLSSAGLVYKHHGRSVIRSITALKKDDEVDAVFARVYDEFIEALDGIDNGVQQYESDAPARYVNKTDLSSRIARVNPEWHERCTNEDVDERFHTALRLAGAEFADCVRRTASSWLPARARVARMYERRFEHDASGEVLVLSEFVPWKDHLFQLEKENGRVKYVLYEDDTSKAWRIQCVPVEPGSFTSRAPLPKQWRALRDQDLSAVTGVEGCVFVHASGFIGGNQTFDGVLALAKKALAMNDVPTEVPQ